MVNEEYQGVCVCVKGAYRPCVGGHAMILLSCASVANAFMFVDSSAACITTLYYHRVKQAPLRSLFGDGKAWWDIFCSDPGGVEVELTTGMAP